MLGDGTVLVQCGPMRMFIEASVGSVKQPELCGRAGKEAIENLKRVAVHRGVLSRAVKQTSACTINDDLVRQMWEAARSIGDHDLTSMSAVAGTLAEAPMNFLLDRGMTKVIVNNGGDIAIGLQGKETVTLGIRPNVCSENVSHTIRITKNMNVGGVATSGFGGRSLTRGVADSVTVFASRASAADAAATAVANAVNVKSPSVRRCRAEILDPDSDIKGLGVTSHVGSLNPAEIEHALRKGIVRAEMLVKSRVIFGAFITVQGHAEMTTGLENHVKQLPM